MQMFGLSACLLISIPSDSYGTNKKFRGITEPYQYSTVSSTVSGKIISIPKKPGATVKRYETIIQLENSEEKLEVQRRKLISESKVELKAARKKSETLKQEYESSKELFKTTQSISKEELAQKELEYQTSVAEIERLEIQEQREEIEFNMAKVQLSKRQVRAPFDGVIAKIHHQKGESTTAQEDLVRVVNIKRCRFITYVEASKTSGMKKGQAVTFYLGSGKKKITKQGKIEFVSPEIDPSSGLRIVKAIFDNSDLSIQPGVSGFMTLNSGVAQK